MRSYPSVCAIALSVCPECHRRNTSHFSIAIIVRNAIVSPVSDVKKNQTMRQNGEFLEIIGWGILLALDWGNLLDLSGDSDEPTTDLGGESFWTSTLRWSLSLVNRSL